jgi:protein-S-isoprenylcysteine O-methyltransferase Ste14
MLKTSVWGHILLGITLVLWCVLHSAMISTSAIALAHKMFGRYFKFYRLIYNAISVLTLLPIIVLMFSISSIRIFEWTGLLRIFQAALVSGGLFFLVAGAKNYDGLQFIGVRQIMLQKHQKGLTESGRLHTEGILRVTRHPWYLSGLFVLWARDLDSVSLLVNGVFSAYLILGAMLEEQKLVQEFGQEYIDYQSRVSMLFPCKWIKTKLF